MSPASWRVLIAARDGLRADLLAAIEGVPERAAEVVVGASRKAIRQWRADGWLAP